MNLGLLSLKKLSINSYEEDLREDEELVEEPTQPQLQPTVEKSDLQSRTVPWLRAMILKRKDEYGLTIEDVKELSKDDLIELLT
jgi:hypothetical protein